MDDLIQKLLEQVIEERKKPNLNDRVNEILNNLLRTQDRITVYEFIRDRRMKDLQESRLSSCIFLGASKDINEEVTMSVVNTALEAIKAEREKLYRDFVSVNEEKVLEFAKEHRRNCSEESCRNGTTSPGKN